VLTNFIHKIELDGETVLERSSFSNTPKPQSLLYETQVDPDVPNHNITLICLDNFNMPFDYFMCAASELAL